MTIGAEIAAFSTGAALAVLTCLLFMEKVISYHVVASKQEVVTELMSQLSKVPSCPPPSNRFKELAYGIPTTVRPTTQAF